MGLACLQGWFGRPDATRLPLLLPVNEVRVMRAHRHMFFFRLLFFGLGVLTLCLFLPVHPLYAQAEVSIMNPNYGRPLLRPSVEQTPYRPRRRYDQSVSRPPANVQNDAELGLVMPDGMAPSTLLQAENRSKILLIGDSFADALSNGIEADPALQRDVTLIRKTSSASGLVRAHYLDWSTTLIDLISAHRDAAALIVMIGLNDSQVLRDGAEAFEPLSEGWTTRYRQRVRRMLSLTREANLPTIWVGLPPMRSPRLSADLQAINKLIQAEVLAAEQAFISVTDAFGDENGAFTLTGPDIIGDQVRLRTQDGIHFTKAGQRKLVFFIEPPLRRILAMRDAQRSPQADPVIPPVGVPALKPEPLVNLPNPVPPGVGIVVSVPVIEGLIIPFPPIKPLFGAVQPLQHVPVAPQLIVRRQVLRPDAAAQSLFDRGIPPPPQQGRSDDFTWR